MNMNKQITSENYLTWDNIKINNIEEIICNLKCKIVMILTWLMLSSTIFASDWTETKLKLEWNNNEIVWNKYDLAATSWYSNKYWFTGSVLLSMNHEWIEYDINWVIWEKEKWLKLNIGSDFWKHEIVWDIWFLSFKEEAWYINQLFAWMEDKLTTEYGKLWWYLNGIYTSSIDKKYQWWSLINLWVSYEYEFLNNEVQMSMWPSIASYGDTNSWINYSWELSHEFHDEWLKINLWTEWIFIPDKYRITEQSANIIYEVMESVHLWLRWVYTEKNAVNSEQYQDLAGFLTINIWDNNIAKNTSLMWLAYTPGGFEMEEKNEIHNWYIREHE